MLQNANILKFIRVLNTETNELIQPKSLEELGSYSDTKYHWDWLGKYQNGRPYYQRKPAIRVLYDHFRCNVNRAWRLRYPKDRNIRNVNPYHVSVANGYNFDRTSPDVQDLVEMIPEYNLNNTPVEEIYEIFDQMYSIQDIEKALKILLPETSE